MPFNSLIFFPFAAFFFVVYFSLRGRSRIFWVVACSYFFYGWWDWRFTSLLLLSTAIDYKIPLMIEAARGNQSRQKVLLAISLTANLSLLGFFKYFNFFIDSAYELLNAFSPIGEPRLLEIILPVGISFFTFQTMSYSIDVYRGTIDRAERSLLHFACYVALFPQLVAGPIVRARDLLPQLHIDHKLDWSRIGRALELIAWGYFLKCGLGDTAATVVDPRFAAPEAYGSLAHIIGTWAFVVQMYGDFAGYTLIAIGLGKLMGFEFPANFNTPYFSKSFSEFWTRWHISLSSWVKDYVYYPLALRYVRKGGGKLNDFKPHIYSMVLMGLWHGAAWTFVLWGLIHGIYLVLERFVTPLYRKAGALFKLPKWTLTLGAIGCVFTLMSLNMILFRAESLEHALRIYKIIFGFEDMSLHMSEQLIGITKTFILATIVFGVDFLSLNKGVRTTFFSRPILRVICMACVSILLLFLGTFEGASFLYFQF